MIRRLLLLVILATNIFGAFSAIIFVSNDNVTVLVRFPAELRCVAFVDDFIHVPTITWYREDGTPVDTSLYDPFEGIVRITSTQLSDEGWYWCNATSGPDNNATRLYLTIRDEIGFLSPPPNEEVNDIGNVALLDCNTTNFNTESSFVWTNGTDPVPLGASSAVELIGVNNEKLLINSVTIYDIGNYTCRVTRTKTSQLITAIIVLSVTGYGPPMTGIGVDSSLAVSIIEIQPDGETRLELHCNIESKLTPDYVWTKEGSVILPERTENGVFVYAGTDIIVFTYANPSDSGLYNCTATNKLGSAWRAYRVTVEEEDDLIWTRWWMILIYCIIFCLFFFALLILLIYVLCTGGLIKKKSAEDTTQLYDETANFEVPFADPETGSQTWEKQFSPDEEVQETGSDTWEKQFATDDDVDDDDDDNKQETDSQT